MSCKISENLLTLMNQGSSWRRSGRETRRGHPEYRTPRNLLHFKTVEDAFN